MVADRDNEGVDKGGGDEGELGLASGNVFASSGKNKTLQENSGILTDIPTENEFLGISRGISEDIPRKHKIWFPRNFLGIYRRNSKEISVRRNILMEYRGKMYSSEKTDEFRGYIIAVREPLGDFKNSEEIPRKEPLPSVFRWNFLGLSAGFQL
ncbi:hypothetical protein DY000_02020758 [Brassica cretica]|uniref:Uncharacterized protein n=1 Tax=Brassica cretica TaxID=69181 RepID=A0ABQ7EK53_BRACR|nr:hypothetical protein DY000_02020758 [Brassica cretica]